MFDLLVILFREIRCLSFLGVKGWIYLQNFQGSLTNWDGWRWVEVGGGGGGGGGGETSINVPSCFILWTMVGCAWQNIVRKMLRNVPSVARNVAQGYMKVQGDYLEVFRSSIEVYDGKTYFNQQVSHWFDDYFFSHIQVRSTLEEALGNFFLEISFVVHPVGVVMELWWRNSRIVSLLSQRESPERSKGPRARESRHAPLSQPS